MSPATAGAGLAAATAVWLWWRPLPVIDAPTARAVPPLALPVLAGLVAALVVGPLMLVPVLVLWAGRGLLRGRRRRVEAVATSEKVLETCELIAAEVTAGLPPGLALDRAAGAWPTLRPVAESATLGGDVPASLRAVARLPGAADLRLVAAAWTLTHRTGGGLGDALDRVAVQIRADRATRRVVRGELSSARATARLVAALPVVVLVLGGGSGAGAWGFLFSTPLGLACLTGGLGLGIAGLWWIERIADGVER